VGACPGLSTNLWPPQSWTVRPLVKAGFTYLMSIIIKILNNNSIMITYLQLTDNSIFLTLNNISLRYWGPTQKGFPEASICLNPALTSWSRDGPKSGTTSRPKAFVPTSFSLAGWVKYANVMLKSLYQKTTDATTSRRTTWVLFFPKLIFCYQNYLPLCSGIASPHKAQLGYSLGWSPDAHFCLKQTDNTDRSQP